MSGLPDDFAFFRQRYDDDLAPRLAAREEERRAAIRRQHRSAFGGLALLIGLAGVGYALNEPWVGGLLGLAGGIGLWVWGGLPVARLARETRLMLIEPIAHEFRLDFEATPEHPALINRIRDLGLVPSWDRASFQDRLTGERAGTPFEFFEAHLEEKRTVRDSKGRTRTQWVTVFRGQCLHARFHKPFSGVTKVYRDMGLFNALMGVGTRETRVRLEDPVFEKAFEVFSSDQIEARFILTPDLMERLVSLERTFSGDRLRCAFSGGDLLLAVEGKDLFEVRSMAKPMTDISRVREILDDFAALFLLIDAVARKQTADGRR
jgi:hypothetical protein